MTASDHGAGRPTGRRGTRSRLRRGIVLVIMAALCSAVGLAITRQPTLDRTSPQTARPPAPTVTVRFLAQATPADGPTGIPRVRADREAPVGGRATARVAAGTASQPDFCHLRTANALDLGAAWVVWHLAATVRAVQGDSVWLSLEWSREGRAPIGPAASASPTDVRVRIGQSHVLDAVFDPAAPASGCTNVLVSVEVASTRVAAEAHALFAYQLTLVHEGAGTRVVSPTLDLVGRPGEAVPFRFRPSRWPVTAGEATGDPPPVEMDVLGDVTATVRVDGQVDVTAQVVRRLQFGGAQEGSGTMPFVARLGEEVQLVLPPPTGTSLLRRTDSRMHLGPLRPGVVADPVGLRIRYGDFLAGVQTSLLVRVERLR